MTDTNLNFRHFFDDLYLTKLKVAICLASAIIESLNLDELTLEQKELKICKELYLLKQKIDDFQNKEYLNFSDNEHQLYNIFSAYLLFHQRDEQAILQESLILNETYKQLSQLLAKTQAQLALLPSNVSMGCLSLVNCNPGLTDLPEEKMNLTDLPDPSYGQLFGQSCEKGILQSEKKIADFKRKYPRHKIRVAEYKPIIFHELKKLRMEFNKLGFSDYYHFLPDKENVQRNFVKNCILTINPEFHSIELSKTIVLDEMIKFFMNELFEMDEDLICNPDDFDFFVQQMNDIISIMVPDCEVINQLQKAISLASQSLAGRKPLLFIIEDLTDSFERIYREEIKKIQHLFYYQSCERKVTYILEQIKDLEYMESNLPVNKATLKPYIVELKNHFISELNYVELQKNHNQTKMDDLFHETQIPIKEKLSFGCKKSPGYLTPFIQALNVKIDFLDHRTTTEDFIRIATSEDLNLINEKIYLGCKTNEFRYLINYLKPLFKSFNPATIGKSGIFISNTGHQINADSIYNSKIDNLQKKFAIDNIFNKK